MRFLTTSECEQWLTGRSRVRPDKGISQAAIRLRFPSSPYRFYASAKSVVSFVTNYSPCLLWITEWNIWSSSENLHLYYRLRQSYQDTRLLHEAPGHYFLKHEVEDLASFLQVAMLFGWGGYILPEVDYVNAFFSHDEFVDFYSENGAILADLRNLLSDGDMEVS